MMSTGEPRCSENEQVRFGGRPQKRAILVPRWRPTLQPAGFGPGVAGKGPAYGGHLASGLPVLRYVGIIESPAGRGLL